MNCRLEGQGHRGALHGTGSARDPVQLRMYLRACVRALPRLSRRETARSAGMDRTARLAAQAAVVRIEPPLRAGVAQAEAHSRQIKVQDEGQTK